LSFTKINRDTLIPSYKNLICCC